MGRTEVGVAGEKEVSGGNVDTKAKPEKPDKSYMTTFKCVICGFEITVQVDDIMEIIYVACPADGTRYKVGLAIVPTEVP